MPRTKKQGCARFEPTYYHFKPKGIKADYLKKIVLTTNEIEALKLHDLDGMSHLEAATKMNLSQSTFTRILNQSYKKLAEVVLLGGCLKLEKNYHSCKKCKGETNEGR